MHFNVYALGLDDIKCQRIDNIVGRTISEFEGLARENGFYALLERVSRVSFVFSDKASISMSSTVKFECGNTLELRLTVETDSNLKIATAKCSVYSPSSPYTSFSFDPIKHSKIARALVTLLEQPERNEVGLKSLAAECDELDDEVYVAI